MKKTTLLIFTAVLTFATFQTTQAQITVGGALMYGDEVEQIGLRADGSYMINDDIDINANIGFYLPDNTDLGGGNEFTATYWEVNVNGHYSLYSDEESGFSAHALAGINILGINTSFSGPNVSGSDSDSELGLNIGGGASYPLSFGKLFGELKYVIGDADQVNIAAGLRIPLGGN
ncbi:MAG: outer membrane beta-barrel protein [Gracilimonas sp.]|uniref:hypothetical protein n=1 Tax=Gracilimonas TaxID=649462 RepID=UPI001B2E787D|nr:hypothetical protein [Gracilimonas sp.]MBO6586249.1 outer membrane beta-barrel protein [Gracilimonas sp.]MBO6614906.1 outer membrane beta-barrel protein [Gracilimonas sp.]